MLCGRWDCLQSSFLFVTMFWFCNYFLSSHKSTRVSSLICPLAVLAVALVISSLPNSGMHCSCAWSLCYRHHGMFTICWAIIAIRSLFSPQFALHMTMPFVTLLIPMPFWARQTQVRITVDLLICITESQCDKFISWGTEC